MRRRVSCYASGKGVVHSAALGSQVDSKCFPRDIDDDAEHHYLELCILIVRLTRDLIRSLAHETGGGLGVFQRHLVAGERETILPNNVLTSAFITVGAVRSANMGAVVDLRSMVRP